MIMIRYGKLSRDEIIRTAVAKKYSLRGIFANRISCLNNPVLDYPMKEQTVIKSRLNQLKKIVTMKGSLIV
jgi:hypothetical protein